MSHRRSLHLLVVTMIAGGLVRVLLAPWFGGFRYDMGTFANWSWSLHHRPLDRFYAEAMAPDHLPGDLWFLKLVAELYASTGGTEFGSDAYHQWLKAIPTVADLGIALLVFLIVRARQPDPVAVACSALYLLNPATMLLTSVWGQWDSLSMALLLTALAVVTYRVDRWMWTAPLLAWGVLIKPPLGPMALLVVALGIWGQSGAWPWTRHAWRRLLGQGLVGVSLGLATVWLLIRPFGLHLAGGEQEDHLLGRTRIALDLYSFKTLSASNLWMLDQGSLARLDDRDPLWRGFSAHQVGTMALVAALALIALAGIVLLLQRRATDRLPFVVWLMMLANMAIFMLPTRVHERYLFPALVCTILLAGLGGFTRGSGVAVLLLSLSFFANLGIVYGGFKRHLSPGLQAWVIGDALLWLSMLNVLVWVMMLIWLHQTWSRT
jgi:hypothetical protein